MTTLGSIMIKASLERSLTQSSSSTLVSSKGWLTGTMALEIESSHNVSGDRGCAETQLTISSSVWLDSSVGSVVDSIMGSVEKREVSLSDSISSLLSSYSPKYRHSGGGS